MTTGCSHSLQVLQLSYLLHTPCSRVLLENLTGFQIVKKFPAFYGTQRFVTAVTSARHLSLSWASSIQSKPPTAHFPKIHLNIILPSTPGPRTWSLSLRLPHQNPAYASPLSHTRYMPAPSPHLILLDFIIRTILGEQYRSLKQLPYCIWQCFITFVTVILTRFLPPFRHVEAEMTNIL